MTVADSRSVGGGFGEGAVELAVEHGLVSDETIGLFVARQGGEQREASITSGVVLQERGCRSAEPRPQKREGFAEFKGEKGSGVARTVERIKPAADPAWGNGSIALR